jgi:hypothetical protein
VCGGESESESEGEGEMRNLADSLVSLSLLLGTVLAVIASPSAQAGLRTYQFAGVATAYGDKPQPLLSQYVACSVMITNTGYVDQFVQSVTFNVFNAATGNTLTTATAVNGTQGAVPLTRDEIYNPGALTTTASCQSTATASCTSSLASPNAIKPGGFYVATVLTAQVAQTGFASTPCSGSFTIGDVTTTGSMMAAGAISYVSEMAITGGQFQGAVYMSGAHAPVGDTHLATNAAPNGGAMNVGSMQMNIACGKSCGTAPYAADSMACDAFCGGGPGQAFFDQQDIWLPAAGTHQSRNLLGYLEEAFDQQYLPSWPANNTDASTNMNNDTRVGMYPFHMNYSSVDIDEHRKFRAQHRMANPHYAGGHVVEMILGPFDTICSGNSAYWTDGGQDFDHGDSVISTDAAYKIRDVPERLLCSHGHNNDAPWGYVAHSSPFPISGGGNL